jgi:hypothetical protein
MVFKTKSTPLKLLQKKKKGKSSKAKSKAVKARASKPSTTQVVSAAASRNGSMKTFIDGFNAQTKELLVTSTVFKDYEFTSPNGVMVFTCSGRQPLFQGSDNYNISRMKSLKVWALPRAANAQVADSSFIVLYGTSVDGVGSGSLALAGQRSTVVNPTFNVKWTLVGETNFDSTFDSAIIGPSGVVGSNINYELARLQLIDPDTGEPSNQKIQLMFQIQFHISLPLKTDLRYSTTYTPDWVGGTITAPSDQYAMTKLDRLTSVV